MTLSWLRTRVELITMPSTKFTKSRSWMKTAISYAEIKMTAREVRPVMS